MAGKCKEMNESFTQRYARVPDAKSRHSVNYLESIQFLIVLLFLFSLANSILFANFATVVKFTAVNFRRNEVL